VVTKQDKIIISGGGTGGHIFPALAIANALKNNIGSENILFVGALGKMEMEKVPEAGYKIEGLRIAGISRTKPLSNIKLPFLLFAAVWKSMRIISKFNPKAVVGVGGFASGPLLIAAALCKKPILIQEQNAFAGITNKRIAKYAKKVCVAYEGMEKFFPKEKIAITGNPVRQSIEFSTITKEEARAQLNITTEKVILIFGGSLGAQSINQAVLKNLDYFHKEKIQLLWQTGKSDYKNVSKSIEGANKTYIKHTDFISDMALVYAAADLVVCRAGALAVAELCILGKPSILVPFPFAAEDHQNYNARALKDSGAAVVIQDKELNDKFLREIKNIISDDDKLNKMSKAASNLAVRNSAEKIKEELMSITK
jgi:UDP-N-acetylglucosamine--N-acetylmuramyl-(pentapeptide) pyrophosphoryl-undecaprenol N-acetylglucosamine transferase